MFIFNLRTESHLLCYPKLCWSSQYEWNARVHTPYAKKVSLVKSQLRAFSLVEAAYLRQKIWKGIPSTHRNANPQLKAFFSRSMQRHMYSRWLVNRYWQWLKHGAFNDFVYPIGPGDMLTLSLLLWSLFRDKILICQSCRAVTNVNDPGNVSGSSSANPTTAVTQTSDPTNNRRRRSSSKTHPRRNARRIQPDRRRTERYL